MYILAQKLQSLPINNQNLTKKSLSLIHKSILLFLFIYFASVLALLYYIPSEDLNNEINYKDGPIVSNQKSQRIFRQIPLYTINISNNIIVGSIRISSSEPNEKMNQFEISGYLYFASDKLNIKNTRYLLVSSESCDNWKDVVQDVSDIITFKSERKSSPGIKVIRKIKETSFELSNKIESVSHFVVMQDSGRTYRQIACVPLNNALKTNTF
ncbi:11575_t:CDS:1 [Funneliformis caledonium]|uniref:11575_t:CDS:1 n=1 Tax=Funneliformis caledonium TaxID=1117310 RepID=A0A9N9DLP0_9GLOM|nr:11575_t:CDS:1 [Funneliformis caledonium]